MIWPTLNAVCACTKLHVHHQKATVWLSISLVSELSFKQAALESAVLESSWNTLLIFPSIFCCIWHNLCVPLSQSLLQPLPWQLLYQCFAWTGQSTQQGNLTCRGVFFLILFQVPQLLINASGRDEGGLQLRDGFSPVGCGASWWRFLVPASLHLRAITPSCLLPSLGCPCFLLTKHSPFKWKEQRDRQCPQQEIFHSMVADYLDAFYKVWSPFSLLGNAKPPQDTHNSGSASQSEMHPIKWRNLHLGDKASHIW